VQGRDINLDIKRVVGYRNFCNKLWQGTRFLLGCFGDFVPSATMAATLLEAPIAPRDRYILSKLNEAVGEVTRCFEEFEFGRAVQTIDTFFRGRLCDVYLELIKPVVYGAEPSGEAAKNKARAVLWTCLDTCLRLLHPMCPFVTEELWQRLPGRGTLEGEASSIMMSAWPKTVPAWTDPKSEAAMDIAMGAIEGARSLRADHNLARAPAKFTVQCSSAEAAAAVEAHLDDVRTLALASEVVISAEAGSGPLKLVSDAVKVFLDLGSVVGKAGAADKSMQIEKLRKEAEKLAPLIAQLVAKMGNAAYRTSVPAAAQDKDKEKLEQYSKKHADALDAISALEA
jgi:valyl-tRNA synthetase